MWWTQSIFEQWRRDGVQVACIWETLSNLILLVNCLTLKVKKLLCCLTLHGMCSRAGWEQTIQHCLYGSVPLLTWHNQCCVCLVSQLTSSQVLVLWVQRVTTLFILSRRCCFKTKRSNIGAFQFGIVASKSRNLSWSYRSRKICVPSNLYE